MDVIKIYSLYNAQLQQYHTWAHLSQDQGAHQAQYQNARSRYLRWWRATNAEVPLVPVWKLRLQGPILY